MIGGVHSVVKIFLFKVRICKSVRTFIFGIIRQLPCYSPFYRRLNVPKTMVIEVKIVCPKQSYTSGNHIEWVWFFSYAAWCYFSFVKCKKSRENGYSSDLTNEAYHKNNSKNETYRKTVRKAGSFMCIQQTTKIKATTFCGKLHIFSYSYLGINFYRTRLSKVKKKNNVFSYLTKK